MNPAPPPIIEFSSCLTGPAGQRWRATGGHATLLLRADSTSTSLWDHKQNRLVRQWVNPIDALHWLASYPLAPGQRWAGYFSYELGRHFENIAAQAPDDLHLPLFMMALITAEFSPSPGTPGEGWGGGPSEVPNFKFQISNPNSQIPILKSQYKTADDIGGATLISSTFTRSAYEHAVETCRDYIRAGDIFQVNLSQRFTVATTQPGYSIFRRLIDRSPAAYGAYLDFGDFAIISDSPELFFSVEAQNDGARRIVTRPIKGTRPNLPGMDRQLRDSIKDQAELNMIVDLQRNDLGRICQIGSVRVLEPRCIETHATVCHGVATIAGNLRADVGLLDLLAAMFPGGSVTGAPKIRAMQIIDELEPVARGPYCGAIGHIDADGFMQFNIAIRTMTLKNNLAYLPVGGAVVADSTPAGEYEETLVKARAMFDAVCPDRK